MLKRDLHLLERSCELSSKETADGSTFMHQTRNSQRKYKKRELMKETAQLFVPVPASHISVEPNAEPKHQKILISGSTPRDPDSRIATGGAPTSLAAVPSARYLQVAAAARRSGSGLSKISPETARVKGQRPPITRPPLVYMYPHCYVGGVHAARAYTAPRWLVCTRRGVRVRGGASSSASRRSSR